MIYFKLFVVRKFIQASFIPICIFLTMNITTSMTRFSQMYNSKVDIYKAEKRKTEKLLSSLLPTSVIRKLKKGLENVLDIIGHF